MCLFSSVLVRDADGTFWLITPAEICRVHVEDAPFLAVEMFVAGCGEEQIVSFRTNVDEIVTVDRDHALSVVTDPATGEPSPYVRLREGIDARLSRSVYYELVARGVEGHADGGSTFGVWSSGDFYPLGELGYDPDHDSESADPN